jgi:hypothetical protein
VARDRVEIGARLVGSLTSRLALVLDATGDVSPDRSGYAVSGTVSYAW